MVSHLLEVCKRYGRSYGLGRHRKLGLILDRAYKFRLEKDFYYVDGTNRREQNLNNRHRHHVQHLACNILRQRIPIFDCSLELQ